MGDPAIAEQLRAGVREAIDALGQQVTVTRTEIEPRDRLRPTAARAEIATQTNYDALVANFEENLIDNEVVKQGDMRMTILANGSAAPDSGDVVEVNANNTFRIVARSTTIISGEDVLYTFVLRK